MKTSHSPSKPCGRKRGFALVVTLSLMILLTVVALGLLSLSSISLRATSRTAAVAEARQNARMALMLALGELQKQAGPDQRSTAVADLAGTSTGDVLAAGGAPANNTSINAVSKGLSALQPGTRYWTGVWGNNNTGATAANEIYTKTPSPKLLQWLVSGNEFADVAQYTPATEDFAVGSDGTVADPAKSVLLVGPHTTGAASGTSIERYVTAPLVGISQRDGSSTRTTGRYGWWVGDEGVKARINIPTTQTDSASYAALTAQRRGWETVEGFADYPQGKSDAEGNLPRVVSLSGIGLLGAGIAPAGDATGLQAAFHAATADSRGLIVDSFNGGTRIDLSAILSGSLPSSNPVSTIANYPVKNTNIIPRTVSTRMVAPKWDAMKEFYDRGKALESGNLVVKAAANVSSASIAPLVTELRVLMGVKFTPATSGTGVRANACGKVAVVLANPYSRPLRWNSALELELRDVTPTGNKPGRIWNLGDGAPYFDRTIPSVFNNLFFSIGSGELAPGEARAYTLGGSTLRPSGSATRTVANMVPFSTSAQPFDFSRCVELDSPTVHTTMPGLDVRESWQTTLVSAFLRLAGSSSGAQPLRSIERFEFDNGYFGANTRNYSIDQCRKLTRPVPLMGFNFRLSQPGEDYVSLMPSGYVIGQRASTMRTYADFNLQGTRFSKPIASYNPPPYFMESNNGFGLLPDVVPGGDTGTFFTRNLDTVMAWGRAFNGPKTTTLFSIPDRVDSLAQFQHADLTGDESAGSLGHQPGNAFANSYATPFVKRSLAVQSRVDYELQGAPNPSGANRTNRNYFDISYLLNTAIWDTYFLSTIPASGPHVPLSPAMVAVNGNTTSDELVDPVECATRLMIDGAFNVNSTDVNAWKAFLGSSKHFAHKSDSGEVAGSAFPRSLEQASASATPPTGTSADSFSGYRRLTDNELDALSKEMVRQVRVRGPFISLSQFINRSLGDIRRQAMQTRSGAIQTAIDESGLTINFEGTKKAFAGISVARDRMKLREKQSAPQADMDGTDTDGRPASADSATPDWAVTSTDNNYGSVASIIAERTLLNSAQKEQGWCSTGIPGWLTQADVLQVIGPSLATRSDTFRIRGYGESVDRAGNTVAKAYCEAIVQRMPDYLDPIDRASARGATLSNINKTYGRKFVIVNFRWLSEGEI